MTPLGFMEIGFGEMVMVGVVALLLFGGRLPEVMRTLGASYRSFRRGWDDLSRSALQPDTRRRPPYQPTTTPARATPESVPAVLAPRAPAPADAPASLPPMPPPRPPQAERPVAPDAPAGPAHDDAPLV